MSLIQLLKFKTRETRLFKKPHFDMSCYQPGTSVTVASGPYLITISVESSMHVGSRFCPKMSRILVQKSG